MQISMSDHTNRTISGCPPLFLVPLLELTDDQTTAALIARICRTVKNYVLYENKKGAEKRAVTDIYVFSHGWHRSFFGAIAAYDRLFSRFVDSSAAGASSPRTKPATFRSTWRSTGTPTPATTAGSTMRAAATSPASSSTPGPHLPSSKRRRKRKPFSWMTSEYLPALHPHGGARRQRAQSEAGGRPAGASAGRAQGAVRHPRGSRRDPYGHGGDGLDLLP